MGYGGNWAPRAGQQTRLRYLEHQLASKNATIDVKIERAMLLSALGRRVEAQQAFVELLLQAPTHFGALNEFGNYLTSMGFIAAALLLLVSSGSGNIPTASFLDDRIFMISVIVADFLDPSVPLPAHQLIFNAIGDADQCAPALEAAARLMERTNAPIINDPATVIKTGRIANAQRLRTLPGVVTPRMIAMPRAVLVRPNAAAAISDHGFAFPLLLRSPVSR
jgi:hypothetical protein